MEKLKEIVPPKARDDFQEILKMGFPGVEQSSLRGYNFYPGLSPAAAQYAYEEWTPRKTDVFLATYPKAGTNFGLEIIRRILHQDEKLREICKLLPPPLFFIEFPKGKKFSVVDKLTLERRLFVTHLPADLVNLEKIKKAKAKVIYILRNPKDQIVSWMNFYPKMPFGKVEPWKSMASSGWNKYFEHVIKGDFAMNSKRYPENILSWYKHRDNETVKFVYFEDLKKNLKNGIKEIAEFLEVSTTEEKIEEIAAEVSSVTLKPDAEKSVNPLLKKIREMNLMKGEVGGWKDYFTVSQSERVDAIMDEKLKDTDIKFIYN